MLKKINLLTISQNIIVIKQQRKTRQEEATGLNLSPNSNLLIKQTKKIPRLLRRIKNQLKALGNLDYSWFETFLNQITPLYEREDNLALNNQLNYYRLHQVLQLIQSYINRCEEVDSKVIADCLEIQSASHSSILEQELLNHQVKFLDFEPIVSNSAYFLQLPLNLRSYLLVQQSFYHYVQEKAYLLKYTPVSLQSIAARFVKDYEPYFNDNLILLLLRHYLAIIEIIEQKRILINHNLIYTPSYYHYQIQQQLPYIAKWYLLQIIHFYYRHVPKAVLNQLQNQVIPQTLIDKYLY